MSFMALTSSSFSSSFLNVSLLKSSLLVRPITRIWMFKSSKFTLKKSFSFKIRSSYKNKVFEDQSEGVICYADENGEIICEGYDEGPRFHQHLNHQREAEIIDLLLKQSWIHLGKGGELSHADKGVAVKEDLNINGFNLFDHILRDECL